jgi:hypothetical protein
MKIRIKSRGQRQQQHGDQIPVGSEKTEDKARSGAHFQRSDKAIRRHAGGRETETRRRHGLSMTGHGLAARCARSRSEKRQRGTLPHENRDTAAAQKPAREEHGNEDPIHSGGGTRLERRLREQQTRPSGGMISSGERSQTAAPHRKKPKHESRGAPREKTLEEPAAQTG